MVLINQNKINFIELNEYKKMHKKWVKILL